MMKNIKCRGGRDKIDLLVACLNPCAVLYS